MNEPAVSLCPDILSSQVFFTNYVECLLTYVQSTMNAGLKERITMKTTQAFMDQVQSQVDEQSANFRRDKSKRFRAAFAVVDVNGDGKLEEREVVDALTPGHRTNVAFHEKLGLFIDKIRVPPKKMWMPSTHISSSMHMDGTHFHHQQQHSPGGPHHDSQGHRAAASHNFSRTMPHPHAAKVSHTMTNVHANRRESHESSHPPAGPHAKRRGSSSQLSHVSHASHEDSGPGSPARPGSPLAGRGRRGSAQSHEGTRLDHHAPAHHEATREMYTAPAARECADFADILEGLVGLHVDLHHHRRIPQSETRDTEFNLYNLMLDHRFRF